MAGTGGDRIYRVVGMGLNKKPLSILELQFLRRFQQIIILGEK